MIELKELYQGAPSNEKPIYPGVYSEDDPCLFGLADYLIDKGFAVRLPESKPAASIELVEQEWGVLPVANGGTVETPDDSDDEPQDDPQPTPTPRKRRK